MLVIDLTGITHHPAIEEIVDVLCAKTQNADRGFFRVEVAYFLAKIAGSQRVTIITKDRGEIPVNIYALALATSGFGKGHSISIMETDFLAGFKKRFMEDTFPVVAEKNLWDIANDRAARNSTDQQEEYEKVESEFRRAGHLPFTYDSATGPAVKQLRHKLVLANCGSLNLQIDEVGSNLVANTEVLTMYLELYDQGMVKQKLIKNSNENQRNEEIDGKTPTNMLLFGTPVKLLDGGQTEDQFYAFLDCGYARRCIFGWGQPSDKSYNTQTPAEIYAKLINPTNSAAISKWSSHFHRLADPAVYGWKVTVQDAVGIELLTYKIECEKLAKTYADHEEIRKAELEHRYFKALKLAGAFAFIDQSLEIEMTHLKQAILLVEESGKAFQSILTREKAYVKLAKYITSCKMQVTHADLLEALPFYKSGTAARNEMMTLATAYGYTNNMLIKKTFIDGIEFFTGETLTETNLDEMMVSYSEHWAYKYLAEAVPFDQLHLLTQAPEMHFTNHHFKGGHKGEGHRARENLLPGFNMIVIDVDHGISLAAVHELLKDYKFLTYTTKRHQTEEYGDRFRIIMPMNYKLELDHEDYTEFMNNIMSWLPFESDEAANQREKKWECFDGGSYFYNHDGALFDVLPFIPKTRMHEQFKQGYQKVESLDNLERWFAQKMVSGNRNNQMFKFASALVDNGMDLMQVSKQVHEFNKKLSNPLEETEIDSTVLSTIAKRYSRK